MALTHGLEPNPVLTPRAQGVRRLIAFIIVVGGLFAPLAAAGVALWPGSASATVYCSVIDSRLDTIGGTEITTDLRAYGNPACSYGSNDSRIYLHWGVAASQVDYIGHEPYRAWKCGPQAYSGSNGVGYTDEYQQWGSWLYPGCDYTADQHSKFSLSGYSDVWMYVNVDEAA